jgi:hypothetical protein
LNRGKAEAAEINIESKLRKSLIPLYLHHKSRAKVVSSEAGLSTLISEVFQFRKEAEYYSTRKSILNCV